MDQKAETKRAAQDRVLLAKARLATTKAAADAVRPKAGEPSTDQYGIANNARLNAADELSAALVAYSDILIRR